MLIVMAVAVAGAFGSRAEALTVKALLVNLVLVIGLYIFAGNSGIVSFGHASFMAIGAYAAAILMLSPSLKQTLLPSLPGALRNTESSPLLAAVAATLVCGMCAVLIGIPLMRLSGIAAALSMFAVLVIVHSVASHWVNVTRGQQGMLGVPRTTTITSAAIASLIAIAVAYAFQKSLPGRRLRASREDEVAAQAVGISVARERRLALVLSAAVTGLGGFLFAGLQGAFTPNSFFLGVTFLTIAMLVVGGVNSLAGAVIGTVAISALLEALRQLEDGISIAAVQLEVRAGSSGIGLAVLMILILVFRPRGLTNGRELWWPIREKVCPPAPLMERTGRARASDTE